MHRLAVRLVVALVCMCMFALLVGLGISVGLGDQHCAVMCVSEPGAYHEAVQVRKRPTFNPRFI